MTAGGRASEARTTAAPDTSTPSASETFEITPTVVGRPSPAWLTALVLWHSAAAHPAVLLVDGMIVAGAFRHLGTTRPVALAAGGLFALASPITGLAAHRTSVQAQGIRWYLKPLAVLGAVLLLAVSLTQPLRLGVTTAVAIAALIQAAGYLVIGRWAAWGVIAAARRRDIGLRPTLVIGTDRRVEEIAAELARSKKVGLRFAAAYTPTLGDNDAVADGHAQAFSLLDKNEIDHVLLVNDGIDESVFREFVTWADDRRGYTLVLPLADVVRHGSKYHIGRFPVLPLPIGLSRNGLIAKRALDIAVSLALLLLTLPLMLLIAAAIKIRDRNPVFFRQQRVGKHGEPFSLLKFRTMYGSPDEHGEADAHWATSSLGAESVPALDRQTPLGRLLRRWDLDELPQLVNVLRGDMSLVGPRPERVSYVARFAPAIDGYDDRHRVRPGMTGWAQINGLRGQTPLALRTAFDNDYVDHWSFGLDLRILLRTVPAIVTLPPPNTDRMLSHAVPPGVPEPDHTGRRALGI
ncbi:MAG TPA: exopolysaccharide biosynthesis polyprenyl glycosylphosphotransferase [Acidimicrobiales bacterium]|nr:exopolysaccharide biosynthesis polyprenyl glycosylphosphotransferase [Acidimicrobiales bacterium]